MASTKEKHNSDAKKQLISRDSDVVVCFPDRIQLSSCDPHAMQRRSRHLLRPSLNSRTCGEDSQARPCLLNENCFQFQYNLTGMPIQMIRAWVCLVHKSRPSKLSVCDPLPIEWSTCQLSENASCGQGVRTRLLSCVRSDGKPVGMDHYVNSALEGQLNRKGKYWHTAGIAETIFRIENRMPAITAKSGKTPEDEYPLSGGMCRQLSALGMDNMDCVFTDLWPRSTRCSRCRSDQTILYPLSACSLTQHLSPPPPPLLPGHHVHLPQRLTSSLLWLFMSYSPLSRAADYMISGTISVVIWPCLTDSRPQEVKLRGEKSSSLDLELKGSQPLLLAVILSLSLSNEVLCSPHPRT
ncbi:hypothetical protein ACRRTK_004356 [Alexandromys fortis]